MPIDFLKSGIYAIRNIINGKLYLGSAINLVRREGRHFVLLKNNRHFNKYLQAAYNKYWYFNFQFLIIEYCEIDKLKWREQHWLNILHCWKRDKGYNICRIADNRLGVLHTDEAKAKMSFARKGKIKSAEWQNKINIAIKGIKRSNKAKLNMSLAQKGKKISDETKKNMAIGQTGRKHSEESKLKRSLKLKGRKVGGFKEGTYNHSEETKRKQSEARKKVLASKLILLKEPFQWIN